MNKSFTLIEILVVIVVIGIISSFIIIGLSSVSDKANIAKGQALSNSLRNSLLMNLVSEWKLDEGAGNLIVDSWSGNTGTLSDSSGNPCSLSYCPQWKNETHCVKDSCLFFDGTSDYINLLNNNNSLNINPPFALETWIKPINNNLGVVFGGYTDGGHTKNFIRIDTSLNVCLDQYLPSGGGFCWGDALILNQWNHVAVSQASSSALIYVNGKFSSYGTVETYSGATPVQWNIGRRWISPSGNNYFNGYLDEIRLYNNSIPISIINQNYYLGLNRLFLNKSFKNNEYSERVSQLKKTISVNP
jgi:prepilin-type N-terminal cleavage/methylation domain-containing protein